jgi:hypothetical protein
VDLDAADHREIATELLPRIGRLKMMPPRWVPPIGRYRTGKRPRLPVDWLVGPRWWASVHWPVFPLFSVSFFFHFLFSVLNSLANN